MRNNSFKNYNSIYVFLCALLCLHINLPVAHGAENNAFNETTDTGLGIGIAVVQFDTSFKFTDKETGQTVFVDAEGTLKLPDVDSIPVIYGNYRFTQKHAIGFSYFKVKRESALFDFDETLDDVQITGSAFFKDETSFFNIEYVNTLLEEKGNRALLLFGLNTLDINYVLEGEGVVTSRDSSTSDSLREEIKTFAPLPLVGIDLMNSFTEEWRLRTQISLVAGNHSDVRAWVVNTNIVAVYQINKYLGATFGIAYFDADIAIGNSLERKDIKYGYDGMILGFHTVF